MSIVSGIYVITNTVNGKRYVGSTAHIRKRWSQHRRDLRADKHPNKRLQRAWNKYGEAAFTFQILEECSTDQLITREQHWIDTYDCVRTGYNIAPIAYSARGVKWTPEQLERKRQRWEASEYRQQLWEASHQRYLEAVRSEQAERAARVAQEQAEQEQARQAFAERFRQALQAQEARISQPVALDDTTRARRSWEQTFIPDTEK